MTTENGCVWVSRVTGRHMHTVAAVRLQHYTSLLRSGGVLDPRNACEGRRVRRRTRLRTGEEQ